MNPHIRSKSATVRRNVDVDLLKDIFFVQLYLCDADVSADIFCQIDHVSLLSQHHDESSQHLRVEGGQRIFFFFFLHRFLFLILICV